MFTVLLQVASGVSLSKAAAAFAASIVVLGAAFGIARIASTALESMARQPEMAGTLRTNMILGCAVTETTGIYSLVISLLILFL